MAVGTDHRARRFQTAPPAGRGVVPFYSCSYTVNFDCLQIPNSASERCKDQNTVKRRVSSAVLARLLGMLPGCGVPAHALTCFDRGLGARDLLGLADRFSVLPGLDWRGLGCVALGSRAACLGLLALGGLRDFG